MKSIEQHKVTIYGGSTTLSLRGPIVSTYQERFDEVHVWALEDGEAEPVQRHFQLAPTRMKLPESAVYIDTVVDATKGRFSPADAALHVIEVPVP